MPTPDGHHPFTPGERVGGRQTRGCANREQIYGRERVQGPPLAVLRGHWGERFVRLELCCHVRPSGGSRSAEPLRAQE